MELIRSFAALSLACGAALLLLPEGSLRRTASLAMGLVLALCWLQGLMGLFRLNLDVDAPETILVPSAASPDASAALSALASHAAGTPVSVSVEGEAPRLAAQQPEAAAQALGVAPERIIPMDEGGG